MAHPWDKEIQVCAHKGT